MVNYFVAYYSVKKCFCKEVSDSIDRLNEILRSGDLPVSMNIVSEFLGVCSGDAPIAMIVYVKFIKSIFFVIILL